MSTNPHTLQTSIYEPMHLAHSNLAGAYIEPSNNGTLLIVDTHWENKN